MLVFASGRVVGPYTREVGVNVYFTPTKVKKGVHAPTGARCTVKEHTITPKQPTFDGTLAQAILGNLDIFNIRANGRLKCVILGKPGGVEITDEDTKWLPPHSSLNFTDKWEKQCKEMVKGKDGTLGQCVKFAQKKSAWCSDYKRCGHVEDGMQCPNIVKGWGTKYRRHPKQGLQGK